MTNVSVCEKRHCLKTFKRSQVDYQPGTWVSNPLPIDTGSKTNSAQQQQAAISMYGHNLIPGAVIISHSPNLPRAE